MRELTESEAEFVAEMAVEPGSESRWAHFDPAFQRKAYDRFLRRGMLEIIGSGRHRQFRWTAKGRALLAEARDGRPSDA